MEVKEAIQKWKNNEFFPIDTLRIAPTERCNLKCIFCSRTVTDGYKHIKELKIRKWLKIIDEAKELRVRFVDIAGGGEPFFTPNRTMCMMKRIKKHGMTGNVTTNGTLITKKLAKKIVEMKWDTINFSIDAPEKELNDKLRGRTGTFERCTNIIKILNHYKNKLKINVPHVGINMVILKENYKLIEKIIKMAENLDISAVNFIGLTHHNEETKMMKLNDQEFEEFSKFINPALKLAKKYKIWTNLNNFKIEKGLISKTNEMKNLLVQNEKKKNMPKNLPCKEPWKSLVIHSDGCIDPCQHNSKESKIGNRGLREIWLNDLHLNKIRNGMVLNNLPSQCNLCCSFVVEKNKGFK